MITRMIHGGAQYNTLHTAADLAPDRYESELATGLQGGVEGSLLEEARARCRLLHEVGDLVREVSPARDVRALAMLVRLMRAGRYDIVHTHTSKAGLLGRVAAVMAGVPVVVHTPHGHIFHGYFGRPQTAVYRCLEAAAARHTDRIITLTERGAREHVEAGVGPPELFVPIHSGVDVAAYERPTRGRAVVRRELGIADSASVLIAVGRLAPVKGHEVLLRAMVGVVRERPGVVLLLAGDGPQRGFLEELARQLGLGGSVRLLGLRADVVDLLHASDVFCLPSHNEGMGRVVVEAMAAGVPVVASGVGGVPELIEDGRTGVLVAPADEGALCAGILRVLGNGPAAADMAVRARAEVAPRYSLAAMLDRIDSLYMELLAEKGCVAQRREKAEG